ncbi:MAG: PQQ-binding-like beta-propeller repeat protein, partial [candidate division Zixibacteria bacterium]|nr:PQQ-binding-like beta-propeller repeat protein [candidate division Zixibacteria bacterium]
MEVSVYFSPEQPILYQDTLQISSTDPAQPQYSIPLEGTGDGGPFNLGYEFWNYQVPDNPSTTFNEYRPLALKSIDDVTGDGYNDVVLATRNYWTICLNGFSSGFASEVWRFSSYISSNSAGGIGNTNDLPPQQRALAVANDLNSDGHHDVVIGTGGGNEHVYALDGTNGNILWQFGTDHPDSFGLGDITSVNVDEDFNGDNINDVIASGSATSGGLDGRRSVYCFDGTNGQIIWQKFLGCFIRMSIPVGDINGNSSLDVIAGTGDGTNNSYSIVAFDGSTTNPIWNFPVGSSTGGGRELVRYPVDGETDDVIAGAYFSPVYRLDGETGTAVWTRSFGSVGFIHEFSLLNDINGDNLKEVLVANATNSFHCLDGATGNTLWSVPLGNYSWSTSAIPDITGDG